jgi:hypothetical protein
MVSSRRRGGARVGKQAVGRRDWAPHGVIAGGSSAGAVAGGTGAAWPRRREVRQGKGLAEQLCGTQSFSVT